MADELVGGALDLVMNPASDNELSDAEKVETVTCPGIGEFGCMSKLVQLVSIGAVRKVRACRKLLRIF